MFNSRLSVTIPIFNKDVVEYKKYNIKKITVEDYINYINFLKYYNAKFEENDLETINTLDSEILNYFFDIPQNIINEMEYDKSLEIVLACSTLIQKEVTEKIAEVAMIGAKEKIVKKEKSIFDELDAEEYGEDIEEDEDIYAVLKNNLFYLIYENMMTSKNTNLDGILKTDIFIFIDFIRMIKEAGEAPDLDIIENL